MKGHMEDGKFHPHTEHKGVRKSRDQTAKTEGIPVERKAREKNIVGNFAKNTDYTIEFIKREDGSYRMIVANNLVNDNPILYDSGSVGWDGNVSLPEYVKEKAERILKNNGRNKFTRESAEKSLKDNAFIKGIEGFGFFVEYTTKNNQKKTSSSFKSLNEAKTFGKTKQKGNEVVNILDGRSVGMIEKVGGINLKGEFSEGV